MNGAKYESAGRGTPLDNSLKRIEHQTYHLLWWTLEREEVIYNGLMFVPFATSCAKTIHSTTCCHIIRFIIKRIIQST